MKSVEEKIYNYFNLNPNLKVLFVFQDINLQTDLREIEWKDGYQYVEFQGDWFTCKYKLDTEWKDSRIVMYFNQQSPIGSTRSMENFLLLDVLKANMEYHADDYESYESFMQQNQLPAEMAAFVQQNISLLQSGGVSKLLADHYQQHTINVDVATRGILTARLSKKSQVMEWDEILINVMLLELTNKLNDFYCDLSKARMVKDKLNQRFKDIFGTTPDVNDAQRVGDIDIVKKLKYNAIVGSLATVEQDDYKALRINNGLALTQMNNLLRRALNSKTYAANMLQLFNEQASTIRCTEIMKWYGVDANYHYVPSDLAEAIVGQLLRDGIAEHPQAVQSRMIFLLTTLADEARGNIGAIIDYITHVAQYYEVAAATGTVALNSPNEYVAKYEQEWWQIDQLYRQAIKSYYDIPATNALKDAAQQAKKDLDEHYARHSNHLNVEWSHCLTRTGGYASLTQLRQWDFYETYVKPKQKKIAVLVCDALRYEMAKEMVVKLSKERHTAKLYTAVATLPTETKFCKPSLLPHKKLTLFGTNEEQKMSVDDTELTDIEKRTKHLDKYQQGAICVPFEKLNKQTKAENREMFKCPLVYIYHNQIDKIGHDSGSGSEVTSICAESIQKIAEEVRSILASYNVTEVIVTADHGFLFNDMEFEDKDKQKVTEENMEQKSRYYITKSAEVVENVAKYPLSEVSGMENAAGFYVAVPMGTNRFNAKGGGYMFTHGGASLQEMLIPVLVCHQERTDTKEPVAVKVLENRLSVQSSVLRFKLLQTDILDMEHKERTVTAALYDNGNIASDVRRVTLDKTAASLDARITEVKLNLKPTEAKVLQLKIYDVTDSENPLIKENVTNNTLIQTDFD